MKSPYLSYLKQLVIFSILLGLVAVALFYLLPAGFITPALPFLFAFFIGVNLIGYYFLIKSVQKKFIKFLNTFLLFTTCKLLLYIVILVLYIMTHKYDAMPFGLAFFILYLFYTIHEIVSLLSYSKRIGSS
jgi:hypothetical protein